MRLFECRACAHLLSFEETDCPGCQRRLGFVPANGQLCALDLLEERSSGAPLVLAHAMGGASYRFCANRSHGVCNWLIPSDNPEQLCLCCRTNRIIPDLSDQVCNERWHKIELAKHRLFYSLLRLGLDVPNKIDDPAAGLSFSFLADSSNMRVMTGHEDGVITLNIVEADCVERERARADMHEPYRTLLGHFRHEIAHYYWDRLVRDRGRVWECRAVFGDESIHYAAALQRYYAGNVPDDWRERHVSQYAAAHPWEDFAETFAHHLHMIDTLETAAVFGVHIQPKTRQRGILETAINFDPYRVPSFKDVIRAWGPLTVAMNSINRSMGQPDLYPFTLGPGVINKLAYIHHLLVDEAMPRQAAA